MNVPCGYFSYNWHQDSPEYEDPGEGLDDLTRDELIELRDRAESAAEDPDVPRSSRAACGLAVREINRRLRAGEYSDAEEIMEREEAQDEA